MKKFLAFVLLMVALSACNAGIQPKEEATDEPDTQIQATEEAVETEEAEETEFVVTDLMLGDRSVQSGAPETGIWSLPIEVLPNQLTIGVGTHIGDTMFNRQQLDGCAFIIFEPGVHDAQFYNFGIYTHELDSYAENDEERETLEEAIIQHVLEEQHEPEYDGSCELSDERIERWEDSNSNSAVVRDVDGRFIRRVNRRTEANPFRILLRVSAGEQVTQVADFVSGDTVYSNRVYANDGTLMCESNNFMYFTATFDGYLRAPGVVNAWEGEVSDHITYCEEPDEQTTDSDTYNGRERQVNGHWETGDTIIGYTITSDFGHGDVAVCSGAGEGQPYLIVDAPAFTAGSVTDGVVNPWVGEITRENYVLCDPTLSTLNGQTRVRYANPSDAMWFEYNDSDAVVMGYTIYDYEGNVVCESDNNETLFVVINPDFGGYALGYANSWETAPIENPHYDEIYNANGTYRTGVQRCRI